MKITITPPKTDGYVASGTVINIEVRPSKVRPEHTLVIIKFDSGHCKAFCPDINTAGFSDFLDKLKPCPRNLSALADTIQLKELIGRFATYEVIDEYFMGVRSEQIKRFL